MCNSLTITYVFFLAAHFVFYRLSRILYFVYFCLFCLTVLKCATVILSIKGYVLTVNETMRAGCL